MHRLVEQGGTDGRHTHTTFQPQHGALNVCVLCCCSALSGSVLVAFLYLPHQNHAIQDSGLAFTCSQCCCGSHASWLSLPYPVHYAQMAILPYPHDDEPVELIHPRITNHGPTVITYYHGDSYPRRSLTAPSVDRTTPCHWMMPWA